MSSTADGDFKTPYGTIKCRYPGPMADPPYDNIQIYRQTNTRYVKLQAPALRAFKAAEERCATRRHPHILITGHGYRSWKDQQALYAQEPGRFANPDTSMHVEADAVDIDMNQSRRRRAAIKRALLAEGWHQAVEGEPWHYSFKITG